MKNRILIIMFKSKRKYLRMELVTRDNGLQIQKLEKEKEFRFGLMDQCMKDIGLTVKLTEEDV